MKITILWIFAALSVGFACAAPSMETQWIGSAGAYSAGEAWDTAHWSNGAPNHNGKGPAVTFDQAGTVTLGTESGQVDLCTSDDGSITVTNESHITIYTNKTWQGNLTVDASSSLTFGNGSQTWLKDGTYNIYGTLTSGWDIKFDMGGPAVQTFNLGLTGRVSTTAKIYRNSGTGTSRTFSVNGSLDTCCTAATPVSHLTLETRVLFETNGGLIDFGNDWLASSNFTDLNGNTLSLDTTLNWNDPVALTNDYIGKYNISIVGNNIVATYVIPEPSTACLWLFGLGAFGVRRRRR